MTSVLPLFALLAFATLTASSGTSPKSDPCSKYDRCSSKWMPKTCNCDSDCRTYGTCCGDVTKPRPDLPDFQCYTRRTANPVSARRSCSEDFRGHVGTRRACFDEDEDETDVKNNLLVTSRVTKVTYWNKHCAACSNEQASDLDWWNIAVFCPSHAEIDRYLIQKNLTFDQDNLRWGLETGDGFVQCFVKYTPPDYADGVKQCTPNLVSSCPEGYHDQDVSAKCSQYYAERKLKHSDTYYKNVHCAICNGIDAEQLECPGLRNFHDDVEESDFRDMVEVTFANGEWLHKEPSKTFECSRGYSYDPFREKCRTYEYKEEAKIIWNAADRLRMGCLLLLAPLMSLLFEMVVNKHLSSATQLSVRKT